MFFHFPPLRVDIRKFQAIWLRIHVCKWYYMIKNMLNYQNSKLYIFLIFSNFAPKSSRLPQARALWGVKSKNPSVCRGFRPIPTI
jgi:hypothetical protein